MKNLDDSIEMLRAVGEYLIPYNYPMNDPALEDVISPLKQTIVNVDGYAVNIHFSRADYGDHYLETCQINGDLVPFIPFNVVAKIGQKFLGGHLLNLIEQPRKGKMYFCWTVCTDKKGYPIPWTYPIKTKKCKYEDFEFLYVKPGEIPFH